MSWTYPVIWLVLMVVFIILEAVSAQLVTIWFALGALAAMLAAIFHAPFWLQITLFAVISVVTLILTRPLAKKLTKRDKVPTNADRVLQKTGVVQETVDNEAASGTILVEGAVWSARSADGSPIPAGAKVIVDRIEGVKCIVKSTEKE